MAKKIFYEQEARERVLAGAEQLYQAVKVTFGPKGGNAVIAKEYGGPIITHDGVTVAENIVLPDDKEETLGWKVGAELVKQAASKLNKKAGDGTTTVTVLTYHILKEANKLIAAGHNPQELRSGIEKAGAEIVEALAKQAESIEGKSDKVAQVATISAGSQEIGDLIAQVIAKIGKDGVVTVEAGQSLAMESEVVEGYSLDKGFASPFFVTDPARQEAVYTKPDILITDQKISSAQDFVPFLEKMAQAGKKDLVIIADEVEGEALSILVLNKLKGVFNTVVIKAPAFGDKRKAIMEDLAILSGATVVSKDRGMTFENIGLEVLGSARKVIVTKDDSTIIEGAGDSKAVKARINELTTWAENAAHDYEAEQFRTRKAALQGKVALIKVGGATETEIDEKKYRVDDAVAATKAALAEGIVPGGGVTLINLANTLKTTGSDAEKAGYQVLRNTLKQPFIQITKNAGLNSDALLAKIEEAKTGFGIDVTKPEAGLVDLKKAGVIDPVRVTREAVLNSVSIAGTAITMGALVVELPEEKPATPDMSGMGMM
ncbi:MAG: molecular chaperone GroEL [Candidatus Saccharibacteria bacterium]|nr:molecular chaperone GroEL [Candidatus Saccharibacteria bacterium]